MRNLFLAILVTIAMSMSFHVSSSASSTQSVFGDQKILSTDNEFELAGIVGGAMRDGVVKNHFVFASQGAKLLVFDASDPDNIRVVNRDLTFPHTISNMKLSGNLLYIAGGELSIVDISNPLHPRKIGQSKDAFGGYIDVKDQYAYIQDGNNFSIVDVTEPAHPRLVGVCAARGSDFAISDSHAYVMNSFDGMTIIDITDPQHPRTIKTYDTHGMALDAVAKDQVLYVANGNALLILDISDPVNPKVLGTYSVSHPFVRQVRVENDFAYVIRAFAGELDILILDVKNPRNPQLVGSVETKGDGTSLAVRDGYLFVTNASSGLLVVDVTDPEEPTIIQNYKTGVWSAENVAAHSNHAFIAAGLAGVRIAQITPGNITEIGNFSEGIRGAEGINDVSTRGNYAFALGDLNSFVLDASNPIQPKQIAQLNCNYPGTLKGNYLYCKEWGNELTIIDVSDPKNPKEIGSRDLGIQIYDMAVNGNYLYIAGGFDGLKIIDISDPTHPLETGDYDTPGYSEGVAIWSHYVIVADGDAGLRMIDVSNPSHPREVVHYNLRWANGIDTSGRYLYVTDGNLHVIDASDPTHLREVSRYDTPGGSEGVAIWNHYALVADGNAGLVVLKTPWIDVQLYMPFILK